MLNKKLKLYIVSLILAVSSSALSAVLVIKSYYDRESRKYDSVLDQYAKAYVDWETYKYDYLGQVELVKQENLDQMDKTKKEYEKLLSEQPSLISQHTRLVQDGTYVPGQQYIANSGSTSQTSKVITVTKPKSTPKTSAS